MRRRLRPTAVVVARPTGLPAATAVPRRTLGVTSSTVAAQRPQATVTAPPRGVRPAKRTRPRHGATTGPPGRAAIVTPRRWPAANGVARSYRNAARTGPGVGRTSGGSSTMDRQ
jgi:hypothetical protein